MPPRRSAHGPGRGSSGSCARSCRSPTTSWRSCWGAERRLDTRKSSLPKWHVRASAVGHDLCKSGSDRRRQPMPIFVYRLVQLAGLALRGWRLPLLIAVVVFLTSWYAMWLAEPGSEITSPGDTWGYFIVTAATVGYGDFFPKTTFGHVVGGYVIVGGIVT